MKNEVKKTDIVELNLRNLKDVNRTDTTFEIKSRIIPRTENGEFSYTLQEIFPSFTKSYPNDELDYSTYINNPDKMIYLAYVGNRIAGQLILRRNWNKYAYIEDIRVGNNYRRNNIGTKLIETAINWAKKRQMPGIMLETQDNNVPAIRFYESRGFKLGGFDGYLYKGVNPNTNEKAIFWYLVF